jgi:hypothetical protein
MIAPMMLVSTTETAVSDGSACRDSLMPIATPAVTDFGASDRMIPRGSPTASASTTTETIAVMERITSATSIGRIAAAATLRFS